MTTRTDTHPCPGPHHAEPPEVDHDKLSCFPHWRQVPRDIQREVYAAYASRDIGRHGKAMRAAIATMRPL